jgi:hypothetical protein
VLKQWAHTAVWILSSLSEEKEEEKKTSETFHYN